MMILVDPDLVEINAIAPDRKGHIVKRAALILRQIFFWNGAKTSAVFDAFLFFALLAINPVLRQLFHQLCLHNRDHRLGSHVAIVGVKPMKSL